MSFGNYEEEDQIPPLIPLRKKKVDTIPIATPSQKNSKENDELKSIMESIKGTPTNQAGSKDVDKNSLPIKKLPNPDKIEEIEKKAKQKISTVQRKDNEKKVQNERQKEFERMKFAIAKRLNSMSMKNLSEELYPVSTEAIQQLLAKIEKDIADLNSEFERKQSTLAVNQNNLHLKKELETMRRQIDHCCLIKQLYHEKLNYRTKIQTLEEDIENLTNENKDLKKKLARALESIENYKHNLPGENEKELKEKLKVCLNELQQEKQMRHTLDRNIDNIINIFKRLYDEADTARQIVTRKLKQLQERQRKLRKLKEQDFDDESKISEPQSPTRRVAATLEHDKDKLLNNPHSDIDHSQTISRKYGADSDLKKSTTKTKGAPTPFVLQKEEGRKMEKPSLPGMTLEQKIRKMRNNQNALNKTFER